MRKSRHCRFCVFNASITLDFQALWPLFSLNLFNVRRGRRRGGKKPVDPPTDDSRGWRRLLCDAT
jgi:hypothetical protein